MPRDYLVFGDIEGKLDVLRVECTKCARKGRYIVRRLIEKYGRKGNMNKWKEQLNVLIVDNRWTLRFAFLRLPYCKRECDCRAY
jgi:hypothetical protein